MSLARRIRVWAGGVGLWRKMAVALAAAALGSGIATYLASERRIPFNENGIFRHYPELDG